MKVNISQYEIREAVKQLIVNKLGLSEEAAKKLDPEKDLVLVLEECSGGENYYEKPLEEEAYWFVYEV